MATSASPAAWCESRGSGAAAVAELAPDEHKALAVDPPHQRAEVVWPVAAVCRGSVLLGVEQVHFEEEDANLVKYMHECCGDKGCASESMAGARQVVLVQ